MDNFIEYERFPDAELAADFIDILETNSIPYKVQDTTSVFQVEASSITPFDKEIIVYIRVSDVDKLDQLYIKEIPLEENPIDEKDIASYPDEDVLDIITHPIGWSKEDVKQARKIAQQWGLKIIEHDEKDKITGGFPEKPVLSKRKASYTQSFLNLGLFVILLSFWLDWDLFYAVVLVAVLLIHEFGHYAVMKIFGYKNLNIFFIPLVGGFTSGSKEEVSQKENVLILLAGPVPGIILGLIFYYMGYESRNLFLLKSASILVIINLFNLLPVIPFDGGKLIQSLFFESKRAINEVFMGISILALTVIAVKTESYFLLIIPLSLFLNLNLQNQVKRVIKAVSEKGISIEKTYDELTNEEYWLIREEIGKNIKSYAQYIKQGEYIISSNEGKIMNLVKSIVQKPPIYDLNAGGKMTYTFVWIMCFVIPIWIFLSR